MVVICACIIYWQEVDPDVMIMSSSGAKRQRTCTSKGSVRPETPEDTMIVGDKEPVCSDK